MEQLVEAGAEPIRRGGDSAPRFSLLRVFQTLIRWEWPFRLASPLLGDFNPFLPEFRIDPYPIYRALQAKHRVYANRLLASYFLPRYDDIVAVLADPRFSVDRPQADIFQRLQPFRGLEPGVRRCDPERAADDRSAAAHAAAPAGQQGFHAARRRGPARRASRRWSTRCSTPWRRAARWS